MKIPEIKNIKTFDKDGRKSIYELYASYKKLDDELWDMELIYNQKFSMKGKKYSLPILGFKTKKKGPALWLIAGIHGEEPAGPNVFAENIGFLNDLARKIPIVFLPVCNPSGYARDWRHPDRKRGPRQLLIARSVGASEHYLPDLKNPKKSRAKEPLSEEAGAITFFVINNVKRYPPILVLDFHEDESSTSYYIYSQGKLRTEDPIAKEIVSILIREKFKIKMKGKTSFGEKIVDGVVAGLEDNSIDELLASRKIIVNKKIKIKPAAKSVIVMETSTKNITLAKRMLVHREILLLSGRFFKVAKKI